MFEILKEFAVKALGRVLPFLVSWYYKPDKLAKKIKIQVRGAGDGVVFECGELPYVRAWLEITNLSPFPVEFERLHGHFWYGKACPVLLSKENKSRTFPRYRNIP